MFAGANDGATSAGSGGEADEILVAVEAVARIAHVALSAAPRRADRVAVCRFVFPFSMLKLQSSRG
jgi:hypothetical protein